MEERLNQLIWAKQELKKYYNVAKMYLNGNNVPAIFDEGNFIILINKDEFIKRASPTVYEEIVNTFENEIMPKRADILKSVGIK